MKWEPIQTAPKDGTPVLVIGDAWNEPVPEVAGYDEIIGEWCIYSDQSEIICPKPTHWMALPEPPQET